MPVQRIGYRTRCFSRVAALGHLWEKTPKDAQRYRWRKKLREAVGHPRALAACSCRPQHVRQPQHDPRRIAEIRRLRTQYPHLCKEKLHVLLAPWCEEQGIPLPSASTLGRTLPRAPDKMRFAPARLGRLGRPKPLRLRQPRKPKGVRTPPLSCVAVDTLERVREGMRRSLLTLIDPTGTPTPGHPR